VRRDLAVLLLFLCTPRLKAECQCPASNPKDQTEQATYVFKAEVWDVALERGDRRVITLDVIDTFKGKPAERLELRDREEGKDCATDFHEGESYLVYARWQWGETLTSKCWGTKRIDQAAEDAAALGPGAEAKAKYYDQLRVFCMGKASTPCCLASLKTMRAGGYIPKPEQGCPENMIPDRLTCRESYEWCVPNTSPRHNR
jgi:hypothetical protein